MMKLLPTMMIAAAACIAVPILNGEDLPMIPMMILKMMTKMTVAHLTIVGRSNNVSSMKVKDEIHKVRYV
jgi:hypothetical protein